MFGTGIDNEELKASDAIEAESGGILENETHVNKWREHVTKTVIHMHMLSDPWKFRKELCAKKDVLKLRS